MYPPSALRFGVNWVDLLSELPPALSLRCVCVESLLGADVEVATHRRCVGLASAAGPGEAENFFFFVFFTFLANSPYPPTKEIYFFDLLAQKVKKSIFPRTPPRQKIYFFDFLAVEIDFSRPFWSKTA